MEKYNLSKLLIKCADDGSICVSDIKLKPINDNDIEIMRQWRNKENITNNIFIDNRIISEEDQIRWYKRYKINKYDEMFIIKINEISVGTVALYNIDYKSGSAEFGRLLIGDINNRGKNIALIATKAICYYGFNGLSLDRINLKVYKNNIKAINLYKKVGFTEIKEVDIENEDIIVMEIYKNTIKYN